MEGNGREEKKRKGRKKEKEEKREEKGRKENHTLLGSFIDFSVFLVGNVTIYIQTLRTADNILLNNSFSKNLSLERKLMSIKI